MEPGLTSQPQLYQRNRFIKVSQPETHISMAKWVYVQKILWKKRLYQMFIISAFMDLQCVQKKSKMK